MNKDIEHLDLLGVFHYVVAGITGLLSLIPLIHVGVGVAFLVSPPSEMRDFPPVFAYLFVFMGSAFILMGLAFSVCLAMAGNDLRQRRRYYFCLVMAGLVCFFQPIGTVLGVFTIVKLMKDSVKELFGVGGNGDDDQP